MSKKSSAQVQEDRLFHKMFNKRGSFSLYWATIFEYPGHYLPSPSLIVYTNYL